MDPYLASVYNTNDTIEKIANQVLVQKLAEAQGLGAEFSQLTPEQIEEIAQEQLSIADEGEGEFSQDSSNIVKEAQANLELADYMGRVMAHAFHQESGMIEKQAGMLQNAGKAIRGAGETVALKGMYAKDAVKPHVDKAVSAVSGAAKRVGEAGKRYGNLMAGGRQSANFEGHGRAGNSLAAFRGKSNLVGPSGGSARGEALKSLGARAGTAAVAGAGAYGAGKAMSKEAALSAFDTLAREQAIALLQQQGIDTQPLMAHFEQQDQEASMMEQQQMMGQNPQQMQQTQFQQPQMGQQNQRMRQPQMGQQVQQQQMQQPQQQEQMMPQDQQSAIKMANDMAMQQFQQMLDQKVLETLAEAGYEVGDQDPQTQDQAQQPVM